MGQIVRVTNYFSVYVRSERLVDFTDFQEEQNCISDTIWNLLLRYECVHTSRVLFDKKLFKLCNVD